LFYLIKNALHRQPVFGFSLLCTAFFRRIFPLLFQFDNGHAALTLAIAPKAEGLDGLVSAQRLLHGGTQRAGALAVDDRDLLELGHDGVIEEALGRGDGLHTVHAAQVDLGLGSHAAQARCVRGGKLFGLRLLVFKQIVMLDVWNKKNKLLMEVLL